MNGNLISRYIYNGDLKPAAELDTAGNIVARYVYAEKANVPEYVVKSGVTYRIITDHLGSARMIVNTVSGSVVARTDYDEYGNVTSSYDSLGIPFGFAGGMYDAQTKLIRFGARDYDANTGRWTSKDPIGFNGGDINLFAYVHSNVVNSNDPQGQFAWGTFFAHTIAGTATGAAIGAGMNIAQQVIESYLGGSGEFSFNWASFFGDTKKGALIGMVGGMGSGLMASLGYSEVIAHHAAHHTFEIFGKSIGKWPHLQITRYLPGAPGSHHIIRIWLPW